MLNDECCPMTRLPFSQLHVSGLCCTNHKIKDIPLNNNSLSVLYKQRRALSIIFLKRRLQWLPLLLLEGTLHFPPLHSISWRDEKRLLFHATFKDLTTLQYAHFTAAPPFYLINSVLA